MLVFILIVLVIGALLAVLFGRGIGQLFVLGTTSIIACIIAVFALIVISGLIYMQFQTQPTYTHTSLGDPTVNTYVPQGRSLNDAPAPSGSRVHRRAIW